MSDHPEIDEQPQAIQRPEDISHRPICEQEMQLFKKQIDWIAGRLATAPTQSPKIARSQMIALIDDRLTRIRIAKRIERSIRNSERWAEKDKRKRSA